MAAQATIYKRVSTTQLKTKGTLNTKDMTIVDDDGVVKHLSTLLSDFDDLPVVLDVRYKLDEELEEPVGDDEDEEDPFEV